MERPILFSASMVRALFDGSKTQTRRIMTTQPIAKPFQIHGEPTGDWFTENPAYPRRGNMMAQRFRCPYGTPEDHLWVREAWQSDVRNAMLKPRDIAPTEPIFYAAGGSERATSLSICAAGWRPSIHMPRTASRITLTVTDVLVQRLQDVSEEDAKAEGIREMRGGAGVYVSREGPANLVTPWPTAKEAFADLWGSINGPDSWNANPWVWAVSFTVEPAA